MLFTVVWRSDYEGRQITACQAQIQFVLGEIYRWISRGHLLCLAVGGFVPLAVPPKNRPSSWSSEEAGLDLERQVGDWTFYTYVCIYGGCLSGSAGCWS
jgi:hypothetical protein